MLRKKALRKIFVTTFSCFILFALYLIPTKINDNYLDPNLEVEYVSNTYNAEIYLLGENNYLVKTNVLLKSETIEDKVKEIIERLRVNSNYKAPLGLNKIIPESTMIYDLLIDNEKVIINFSKDLLNVDKKIEERLIEAIVYSVTTLNEIDTVIIRIDGNNLTTLPQSNKILKEELTREFGINKVYDITNRNGIQKVTIYYMENISNNNYYVPVTKYLNDGRDKIKIIIDNLSSSYLYEDNLLSYLANDVMLLDYKEKNNILEMDFNKDIFSTDRILESIEYTLSYSLFDNYDVDKLVIKVNGEEVKEIDKCVIKMSCNE